MSNKEQQLQIIKTAIENYCQDHFNFNFNPQQPIVRLHEPTVSSDEIFAAVETMLSTFTTMGKKVRAFEKQYANYVRTKYAVMSNSGSSANLLAVAALANPVTPDYLRPGDEVIVPALSWSTTIWPVIQHNLIPVIVDCDLNTFNFDLNKLEAAIGPKTRAIKLVHVYGNPIDMDAVMSMAKRHNLFVIEDCCEAMGAKYKQQPVGSFGHISNYSFFFSHHISTMEGGISVTNDFNLAETMRILRAHGWSREADEHQKYIKQYPEIDPRFIFINLGYNLRPTEVHAAIAEHQLPKLDTLIDKRRAAANYFLKTLAKYQDHFHFQTETPHSKHVWFGFPIIIKPEAPFTVKDITRYLQQNHIETRPIIAGNMARHPAFKLYPHRIAGDLANADTIMQHGFAFACHHAVAAQAQQYITDTIDQYYATNVQHHPKHEAIAV